MTDWNSPTALPAFFEKNPDLKSRVESYLSKIPEGQKRANYDLVMRFVSGEISWSEIQNVPKSLQKFIAGLAYNLFQSGEFKRAESIFRGLAVLDHFNWYYRSALGAIYQKQNRYEEAIDEYSAALALHPDEVTSLVNRGQCLLKQADEDSALKDFLHAANLPLQPDNPWHKRAIALSQGLSRRLEKKGS